MNLLQFRKWESFFFFLVISIHFFEAGSIPTEIEGQADLGFGRETV